MSGLLTLQMSVWDQNEPVVQWRREKKVRGKREKGSALAYGRSVFSTFATRVPVGGGHAEVDPLL